MNEKFIITFPIQRPSVRSGPCPVQKEIDKLKILQEGLFYWLGNPQGRIFVKV